MLKQSSQQLVVLADKTRAFLKTDLGIALLIVLIWQAFMTGAGYIIDTKLHLPTTNLFTNMPQGILGHTLRWDAGWYVEIIHSDFYRHTSSSGAVFAFYPLYPLLVGLTIAASFNLFSLQVASLIINTVATIATLVALIKIGAHFLLNKKLSILAAILFLTSPAAMFLHVFYSEAIFIALGAWAYLFALRQRWKYMALILAVLSAARLPAILFIALCGLEFLRSYRWNISASITNRSFLWFLIAPAGFITYSVWCYVASGDPLAMFHAYAAPDGWSYQIFNPNILATMFHALLAALQDLYTHGINRAIVVNNILPLGSLFILLIVALYALLKLKGRFVPLGIFSLLSIILFTLNSNVISVHRYSLACISIFITGAYFFSQYKKIRWVLYLILPFCFLLQIILLTLFVTGHFAG